ncbi:MAG: Pyruvate formate-lyase 1-activating enzyme [Firmicutes bacterium ADurb.Bin153]|nr:MAG: Pyruvate formate-lyase 1-activating enzyme [Firmicutes bacterium ADurb.Bin153]
MTIGGYMPFSLSDYPGAVAAVVFLSGCNFDCPFCHNWKLIDPAGDPADRIPYDAVMGRIAARKDRLDAVVVSGGEPTISDGLPGLFRDIHGLGLMSKLDTNGSDPGMISSLLGMKALDFIAMDIKAPFDKYRDLAGTEVDTGAVRESIGIISRSGVGHVFRTTYVPGLLDDDDISAIERMVPPGSRFVVQEYRKPPPR